MNYHHKEIYSVLYKFIDEDGNQGEDLREIQLLENFSKERINKLIILTNDKDRYIAYQAMLILIAWGIDEGFKKLDEFIENRIDEQIEFEPRRIYGEDNVYDVISDALYISTYNTNDENKILPYIKTMLEIYSNKFFESKLKSILLKMNNTPILLPIIAKYEEKILDKYIGKVLPFIELDKRIKYNIDEIQEYK